MIENLKVSHGNAGDFSLIRNATIADSFRIAEIQVASWRAAYQDIILDSYLSGLNPEQRERSWRRFIDEEDSPVFVAYGEEAIRGFCHVSPSRDSDTHNAAEIIAIYIEPAHWRNGIGRLLCAAALSFARARHFDLITLWTLVQNIPARQFYEALGFQSDGASKNEDMAGFTLNEIRYRLNLNQGEQAAVSSPPV